MDKVFDKDIAGTKNSEGEMIKLLKIGLHCCEADLDSRWDIKKVVEKIEEVKEKDADDDFYSSYTSECDMMSSRGLSDDFLFNNTVEINRKEFLHLFPLIIIGMIMIYLHWNYNLHSIIWYCLNFLI